MPSIARLQVSRPIQLLTEQRLHKLILQTHPNGVTSDLFQTLERLCKTKDYDAIIRHIMAYLRGPNAIHSVSQLNSDFISIHEKVVNGITCKDESDDLVELCAQDQFSNIFAEEIEDGSIRSEYMNVADTLLVLSIVGKVGHKSNLDYTKMIKSYHLIDRIISRGDDISFEEIQQFLEKQVVLPSCFFELNPCTKKLEPIDLETPFNHLRLSYPSNQLSKNKEEQLPIDNPNNQGEDKPIKPPIGRPEELSESPKEDDNCDCKDDCDSNTCCEDQNPCCASIFPYVSDLMVINEELHCYEAKHLAYIETVMLGETRKREHRHLERTEDYTERETTVNKSEERDHQVAQRFSLQTEMQKTLDSDFSLDAGVTVNTKGPSYSASATLDVATSVSKSESQRIAREQAVDVTDRTVRKIQETVRELNSQKRILEIEETNVHKFENKTDGGGEKHINGMYQFVNMISKGQVMNYGKRLMFEFVLPEPLELYKKLQSEEIGEFGLKEPVKPTIKPQDIKENATTESGVAQPNYYVNLVKKYQLQGVEPLIKNKIEYVSTAIQQDFDPNNNREAFAQATATVPEGYNAVRFHISGGINWGDGAVSSMVVVGTVHTSVQHPNYGFPEKDLPDLTGIIPINFTGWGVGYVSMNVNIKCVRKEEVLESWQMGIYEKIMDKYESDLQKYNAEKSKYDAQKELKAKLGRNPYLNREIERTELKRMAISYISCQFYDQFTAMKNKVEPCGYPQMDLEQSEEDGKFIQFFEQLFDWNLMTYIFYPYFWGKKCSWAEKVQSDSGDALFDKALMAGAARVQVPVRVGHEPLAIHWITFGEIWNGSDEVPTPNSPYFISMAQELKEQKGVFYRDREGKISVSSNSNIVQLTESSYYWDFDTGTVDQDKIDDDINREIIIDCEVYKIVSIEEVSPSSSPHNQWTITLESNYEGETNYDGPWSTGALFVGAPFKITVPTSLVYLKNKKVNGEYVTEDCLPCFPEEKCG